MNNFRKLLWPFVPLYYLGSLYIKKMYDWGVFKSVSYTFPVITVGNLSVGGTGKSPFVIYLLKQLSGKMQVATLSRGYKRNSKGFQEVKKESLASKVGDEPLQFKQQFNNVHVVVDADRRNGINQLKKIYPNPDVVVLDDAFQHRKVKAGLQILLTPYYDLYVNDVMLPVGNLREPVSAAARADIILVTKCPADLRGADRDQIVEKLNPLRHQKVYFTSIVYASNVFMQEKSMDFQEFLKQEFCLVTGIANPEPLLSHLRKSKADFKHLNFPDHHSFSESELNQIADYKLILTTEKDFMRLKHVEILKRKLYYLPISIEFLFDEAEFLLQLNNFVSDSF